MQSPEFELMQKEMQFPSKGDNQVIDPSIGWTLFLNANSTSFSKTNSLFCFQIRWLHYSSLGLEISAHPFQFLSKKVLFSEHLYIFCLFPFAEREGKEFKL